MTVKGKGGRPKAFNSVQELEQKIEEFYDYCEQKEETLTFERLATFVGVDRRTLYNYDKKDEYFLAFKKVRERILADIMSKGLSNKINTTFGIFCLKNYGYTDRQEIESNNINTNKNINLENLSTEEIKELLKNEQ